MSETINAAPANSRYHGLKIVKVVRADGAEVACLERRFLPDPARFAAVGTHVVCEGDRLDNIAATLIGDPELAWRIADANRAMRPGALTDDIGRQLVITLPEGLGGPTLA